MNKTVNINLAGIFFHIDEDAYLKLQRYLEAIKRSFTDSQGRSEIIADIEARIAELFTERIINDRQVIGNKEVEEVIAIMGQPEDYLVDDEIFEDEPQHKNYTTSQRKSKKLFRDTENSYVSGVSSGLGHYFGIDALWIRILWLVLVFGGFGTGILIYILLWILVPEAKTTSEKIVMTGEKVTISNIEKKIKDGFSHASVDLQKAGDKLKEGFESASDSISNSVKHIDVSKQGSRIKSSSQTFFDTIADIFMFFLKVFAKFIGLILMFTGATGAIATTVGLLISAFGDSDAVRMSPDFLELANTSGVPFGIVALLGFFALVIPFLMLFYLGLKILINNLKSIGNVAKFTLLGVWLLSIIGLVFVGVRQGLSYKDKAQVVKTEKLLNIKANDTLTLSMEGNDYYAENFNRYFDSYSTGFTESGEKVTYSQGIRLIVKSTKDSVAKIRTVGSAKGNSYNTAKERAENIDYSYVLEGNLLKLNNHFLIPNNSIKRDQRVEVTLYLPEGSFLIADKNTYKYHSNPSGYYNDILDHGMEDHYLEVKNNELYCSDCPTESADDDDFTIDVNINNDNAKLKINTEGIEASSNNNAIKIDEDGVNSKTNNVEVNIDEDGIKITSEKEKE
ncbi:PspC domain-containing protein [Lacinutrix chionoecetis]